MYFRRLLSCQILCRQHRRAKNRSRGVSILMPPEIAKDFGLRAYPRMERLPACLDLTEEILSAWRGNDRFMHLANIAFRLYCVITIVKTRLSTLQSPIDRPSITLRCTCTCKSLVTVGIIQPKRFPCVLDIVPVIERWQASCKRVFESRKQIRCGS